MRSAAIVLALVSSGCFASWVTTQATGTERAWDEGVRAHAVPLPGARERLVVSLPTTAVSSSSATTPAPVDVPFAVACKVEQYGTDAVYQSAYRYGSRWKKLTALAFVLEGALAAAYLVSADEEGKSAYYLYGGALAADALGTAALFFVPRKEIYRRDEKASITPIRDDCPDGISLVIGDERFDVDAAGRIGELGELVHDEWRRAPTQPLLVTFEGRTLELRAGVSASFDVPLGALSRVASARVE